jgi:hypothetical protein
VSATSTHSNDGLSDINGSLLLQHIIVTGYMISEDHCYCGARSTCAGATSSYSSDGLSNISEPLLLPPTVATSVLTSVSRRYWPPQ